MASKRKIVFQGEPGANSDLACRKAYPGYVPVPCPTFEEAFESVLAAKIYGLEIVKRNIEDAAHNPTRFIVLAHKPTWPNPNGKRGKGRIVTTFVFQVRNIPAALYKALGGFATNGINMTKLESYMIEGSFSATQFYADVEGHPKDRALELALEELDFVSRPDTFKILGVYPGHRY